MGQVVMLASGKGGVGKSTICGGLCAALARRGKRVLAIDCDAGLRNLDLILGLENQSVYNVADVLSGKRRLSESMVRHGEHGTLFFLAASTEPDDPLINADYLSALVLQTGGVFDYIFLDSPSGAGRLHRELAQVCNLLLIVSTTDYTAVRAADRTAQLLGAPNQRLIINRINPELIKKRRVPNIDEIVDMTALRLIGMVPEDPQVTLLTNAGHAVCGAGSKAGIAVENIAARIEGHTVPVYRFW